MSWTAGTRGQAGDGPGKRVRLRICRHRGVMDGTALHKLWMIEREASRPCCGGVSSRPTSPPFCHHKGKRTYFHRHTASISTHASVALAKSHTVRARVVCPMPSLFPASRWPLAIRSLEESRSQAQVSANGGCRQSLNGLPASGCARGSNSSVAGRKRRGCTGPARLGGSKQNVATGCRPRPARGHGGAVEARVTRSN